MSIKTSSRTLVATFVVASLTASPALASGGPMDLRSPDAKDSAARPAAILVEPRSPDAQDAAARPAAILVEPRSPDAQDAATRGAADLRVAASLAGPPPAAKAAVPVNTPVHRPAAPVSSPAAGNGFDVGDAFVGAGGAAVLLVSVAGGLALSRRRRIATAA